MKVCSFEGIIRLIKKPKNCLILNPSINELEHPDEWAQFNLTVALIIVFFFHLYLQKFFFHSQQSIKRSGVASHALGSN